MELGNLYYSLSIKSDNIDKELENIVKKIQEGLKEGQRVKIGQLELDKSAAQSLVTQIQNAANGATIKAKADVRYMSDQLKGKSLWVKLSPSVANKDLADLKNRIAQKLADMKLQNISLTVDRAKVQRELDARPFTARLTFTLNPGQIQQAINSQLALTAAQSRGIRAGQAQQRQDDLHAESLLRQQKLRQQLNHYEGRSLELHKSISGQMKTTTQIATMLGNAMGNVFSVYAVKSFLTEVVRVGGELEKQNLAMRSILGNASEADEIYGKLKKLSMISPFDVEDLVMYTKQLSAFGIEYTELYDTAKRLSDIAAGVGVSFSRIAYEYGQTSARGWLDGRELRMFANSGIPLLEKLSKHYSKLRDEIVSTSQVREMVSNREVSFKDVQTVLWDMTNEGGEFYQMQEVMAESLAAKWRNLGNAWNLMMGEIATGVPGDALKGLAETLTTMTKHWSELSGIMAVIGVRFMASKTAMMANNVVLGKNTTSVIERTLAEKALEAEELRRVMTTRNLTKGEQIRMANSQQMTLGDYRRLVVSRQLTADEALRAIAYGKSADQFRALNAVQQHAYMKAMGWTLQQKNMAFAMSDASKAVRTLRLGMMALGTTFKNLGTMLWTNKFAIIIMALMELYMYIQKTRDAYNDMVDSIAKKGSEGFENIQKFMDGMKSFKPETASAAELTTTLEEMRDTIKEFDPDWMDTFTKADKIEAATEQYGALKERLEDIKEIYRQMAEYPNILPDAIDSTNGLFDESVVDNANDFHKAMQNIYSAMNGMNNVEVQDTYERLFSFLSIHAMDFSEGQQQAWKSINEQINAATTTAGKLRAILSSDLISSFDNRAQKGLYDAAKSLMGGSAYFSDTLFDLYTKGMDAKVTFTADTEKLATSLDSAVTKYVKREGNEGQYAAAIHALIKETLDQTDLTEAERQLMMGDVDRILRIKVQYQYNPQEAMPTELQQYGINAVDSLVGQDSRIGKKVIDAIKKATGVGDIQENVSKLYDDAVKELAKIKPTEWSQKQWSDYKKEQENIRDAAAAALDAMNMTYGKKSKTSGSTKDPVKEMLEERLRLIKEMYNEYKSWLDIYHNEDKAIAKTKENPLFANAGIGDPSDIVKNYEDLIDDIRKYGSKYGKIEMQARSGIFAYSRDEVKRSVQEMVGIVKEQMDEDLKDWNLYKKLFEASGDQAWSMEVAKSTKQIWDGLALEWANALNDAMAKSGRGGELFDYSMTSEEAKRFFGDDVLYEQWLAIKKRIESNGLDLYQNIAEAVKSYDTLQSRIDAIEAERSAVVSQMVANGDGEKAIEMANKVFDDRIGKLKQQLFAGSDVYKRLMADTTNFGMAKLTQLKELAKKLRNAMDAGTTSKDENGNLVYDFTYGDQKFQATEKNYEEILKLIEKLEKKAHSTTESFKNMWKWVRGENGEDNEKLTFADVEKDLRSVFDYFADTCRNLAKLFGEDSKAGIQLQGYGDVFTGLGNITEAIGQFQSGDFFQGVNSSVKGVVNTVEGIGKILHEDNRTQKLMDGMHNMTSAITASINRLTDVMKSQTVEDSYETYRLMREERERDMANRQKTLAEIAGSWGTKIFGMGADYHSISSYVNKRLSAEDWANISKATGKNVTNSGELFGLGSEDWNNIIAYAYSAWGKIKDAIEADKDNPAASSMAQDLEEFANMTKQLEELDAEWASYVTGVSFDDIRNGFDSLVKDMSSSMADFADSFEEMMYNAIVNKRIMDLLGTKDEGLMHDYMALFADYAKDGLDETEIADLRTKYDEMAQIIKEIQGEASAASGWKGGSADSSLSSSIQGVSADEVGALSAYVNGIRADVASDRASMENIANVQLPGLSATASAQLAQLNMQTEYLRMISDRMEAWEDSVLTMASDVHAVTIGTKAFRIN